MNKTSFALLSIAVLLLTTTAVMAAEKPQTSCPVSGEPIDTSVHVDWQGQRVYFCCTKCPLKFKADPEKYFALMAAEGVVAESVQTTDPVCGMDQNPEGIHADYKGRRVYFCSEYCKGEFGKDPVKYLDKLPGQQNASK